MSRGGTQQRCPRVVLGLRADLGPVPQQFPRGRRVACAQRRVIESRGVRRQPEGRPSSIPPLVHGCAGCHKLGDDRGMALGGGAAQGRRRNVVRPVDLRARSDERLDQVDMPCGRRLHQRRCPVVFAASVGHPCAALQQQQRRLLVKSRFTGGRQAKRK
ncbi:MAG: hypothetical protein AW07_04663 [Candidatus Accumulibacter sp. SK-11]|nr:MAG: hypothetical protein AW07_04663 [Candidatus Accumulibacter sp. SK-11]